MKVEIDGHSLTIEQVVKVAREHICVSTNDETIQNIFKNREIVSNVIKQNKTVYGISTGFGDLARIRIPNKDLEELQYNLLRSHAVGVGDPLPEEVVRAAILLRANALLKGYSGVRPIVIMQLINLLNKRITPIVPEKGSVGASGDLAPLAHIALVLIGEGKAKYKNKIVDGKTALQQAGLTPIELMPKEGLALINGTQIMTAIGALAVYDAENLLYASIASGALTFEALRGIQDAFDERIQKIREHKGQNFIARAFREILKDSKITGKNAKRERVQDAYSLRTMPQVLGAIYTAIQHVKEIISNELNAATDNPLVFNDGSVLSGGNFHGEPIALVMDYLGIAIAELGNIAERRINRLVDPHLSGLPAYLIENNGLNSGFMITQYTAAALVSENKVLAHPASVDSIPTSANQEDHVSMGTIAARKAREIIKNVQSIISIELLAASQGLDFVGPDKTSKAIKSIYDFVRTISTHVTRDRSLHDDIEKLAFEIKSGKIAEIIKKYI